LPESAVHDWQLYGVKERPFSSGADWLFLNQRKTTMEHLSTVCRSREPWNKRKPVSQKAPFKLKETWAIRIRLQLADRRRELALFNLAIDGKLRGCDLVSLRVRDVCHGQAMATRAIVPQQKTQRPVQFEITQPTREEVGAWIGHARLTSEDSFFSKPRSTLTASIDTTIRPDRRFLGEPTGIGEGKLRKPHAQEDQSHIDLSSHEEPPRRATAARARQARKYGALPRHRG
jgi:hypothetical protein